MTAPVLTLDGDIILADGVPILSLVAGPEPGAVATGPWSGVALAIDAPQVRWSWDGNLDDLAWRIVAWLGGAGLVADTVLGRARENLDEARWETDPATRAPFLREFDRLMQVAALWRRFIP